MPTAGQRVKALDFTAAVTASNGTAHNNVGTTLALGSPGVSVTFTAPTSGMAQVVVSMRCQDDTGSNTAYLDYEVRLNNGAGAIIFGTGSVDRRLDIGCTGAVTFQPNVSKVSLITGLTAGSTYFAQVLHAAAVAGSADVLNRQITVIPL